MLVEAFSGTKKQRRDAIVKHKYFNKTRTSKVGAISKAQKAQNIFFGKKLEFLIFFFRKMSKM